MTYAFVFEVRGEGRVQDESVLALNGLCLNVKPATFAHVSLAKGSCGLSWLQGRNEGEIQSYHMSKGGKMKYW